MIANYHTHTWRCLHATGTEREYVENAIQGGLQILGFSDHTPMPYPNGYVSPLKMRLDQLEDYVTTVHSLKKEYENDIQILLGLEVEYYPAYFHNLLTITRAYPFDYFLLAQHFLGNEINDVNSALPTQSEVALKRYCMQCLEALETGCFTYLAHPDLFYFVGDDAVYEHHMRMLCQGAKELNIPLEINFLGIWDHRHYPNLKFWEIAGQVQNTVVFGADAHQPEKVWNPQALKTAKNIVNTFHLHLTDTVTLRSPKIS